MRGQNEAVKIDFEEERKELTFGGEILKENFRRGKKGIDFRRRNIEGELLQEKAKELEEAKQQKQQQVRNITIIAKPMITISNTIRMIIFLSGVRRRMYDSYKLAKVWWRRPR